MGLLEEIEETKQKLAEVIEAEDKALEEELAPVETTEEVVEEQPKEEAAEEPAQETKDEEPKKEEEKPINHRKQRLEKKAQERIDALARDLEAKDREIEALRQAATQPRAIVEEKKETNLDPEPDRATKYEAWLEWKDRQLEKKVREIEEKVSETTQETANSRLVNAAIQEFQSYENDFQATEPKYSQAAQFYTQRLGESIKMLHPQATSAQIGELIRNKVLEKASLYVRRGLDPAEELFYEAQNLGFSSQTEDVEEEEVKEIRPNLAKVAANRQRNAGTAGAKGKGGGGVLTRQAASELSVAEWSKLPSSEKKRLLNGG